MSHAARKRRFLTLDDYFDIELMSEAKHEYVDGEVLGMAGGSVRHNRIASNVLRVLATTLRGGPCQAFGSDQRLATPDGTYTYPDVAVYCGAIQLIAGRPDTATNPSVLVEVLSDSTRGYDLGDKLDRYRAIPGLRDLLFVETDRREVLHWSWSDGEWTSRRIVGDGTCELVGCGARLPLAEVYEGV